MSTPFELTAHVVNAAKPKAKEYSLRDSKLPGLSVRIQPNGAKSWVLRLSVDGKPRKITLGRTADINVREARDMAADRIASLRLSKVAHVPKRSGMTFGEVAERFQQAKRKTYKPKTLKSLKSYLTRQLIPAFGMTHVSDITTPQVAIWFHGYSETAPGGANRALEDFRSILSYARTNGLTSPTLPDPSSPLRKNKRPPRGRLLSTDQLLALGTALREATSRQQDAAQAIHLMLLTGCRSGEILRLQWEEVKRDRLSLIDGKTGPRDVMLTRQAKVILRDRLAAGIGQGKWVFPSDKKPSCQWQFKFPQFGQSKIPQFIGVRLSAVFSDLQLHSLVDDHDALARAAV